MLLQVLPQRLEVGGGSLTRHEAQLHEPAGRVIDKDQQRAGLGAILESTVLTSIDLDQLTVALTPQPWLVKRAALLARQP